MTETVKLSSMVANDDGSSYNKLAWFAADATGKLTIKTKKCATQIARGIPNLGITSNDVAVINVNGETFTIDPYTQGYDVRGNDDHQFSNGLIACNQVALASAGFGGKKVFLSTGLPFETYFLGGNGKRNTVAIEKKENAYVNAKILNKTDDKGNPTLQDKSSLVEVVHNTVLPEAVGAYMDITLNIDGSPAKSFDRDVLVIDMGSYTTDIALIGPGGRIRAEYSYTKKDMGFLKIYTKFVTELKRNSYAVGDNISHAIAEKAFETGYLSMFGKGDVDVSGITSAVVRTVVREIIESINSRMGDQINTLAAIICVGGGAKVIKDHFGDLSDYIYIPEDPQFANAKGFLKLQVYRCGFSVEDDITTNAAVSA